MSSAARPTALVTGASSGIGLAFARLLASKGYDLVLVARREELLRALAREVEAESAISARVLVMDLTSDGAVNQIAGFLDENDISIDLLVNNAGFGRVGAFHEMSRTLILKMIQLNMTVVADLTRLLLPAMVERRSGSIINVASSAAFQPSPLMGLYHATKAFVLFLTEALAEEVRGSGVRITAVCPGPVGQTDFGTRTGTDLKVPNLYLVQVPAAKVAADALRGVEKGKTIVVPGRLMRASSWISPRLPRWLVRKITHRIQRSRAPVSILPE